MNLNLDFWQIIVGLITVMGGLFGGVRLLMGMAMRGADQATKTFVELSGIVASQANQLQESNRETSDAHKETIAEMKKSLEFMADMNTVRSQLLEMQDVNVSMQTTMDKLSANEAQLQNDLKAERNEKERLRTEVDTLKADLDRTITDWQNKYDGLNKQYGALSEKYQRLSDELKQTTDKLNATIKDRDGWRDKAKELEARLSVIEKKDTGTLPVIVDEPKKMEAE